MQEVGWLKRLRTRSQRRSAQYAAEQKEEQDGLVMIEGPWLDLFGMKPKPKLDRAALAAEAQVVARLRSQEQQKQAAERTAIAAIDALLPAELVTQRAENARTIAQLEQAELDALARLDAHRRTAPSVTAIASWATRERELSGLVTGIGYQLVERRRERETIERERRWKWVHAARRYVAQMRDAEAAANAQAKALEAEARHVRQAAIEQRQAAAAAVSALEPKEPAPQRVKQERFMGVLP